MDVSEQVIVLTKCSFDRVQRTFPVFGFYVCTH